MKKPKKNIDVYETAWYVLETLHKHGSLNANQIQIKTKKISRATMYDAFPILIKEKFIQRDKNKLFSLNVTKYEQEGKILSIYEEYEKITSDFDNLFSKITEKFKNHTAIFNPNSESDKNLVREVLQNPPLLDIISIIVRLFELGSLMDFFINSDAMSQTIEKRAISLKRKNEKIVSKFMNIIRNAEPVLWGEFLMLIQTRLTTKITPA